MKTKRFILALATLTSLTTLSALAQVSVSEPWVRATVSQQKATGAFMQLKAEKGSRLVEARSPVAGVVEVHEMAMQGEVMKMRALSHGLEIAKGHSLVLKPGGYHVMLMELKQQLKAGDRVSVTLTFEDVASKQRFTREVQAPVTALGGAQPAPAAHHRH